MRLDRHIFMHRSCLKVVREQIEGPICQECHDELRDQMQGVMAALRELY